MVDFIQFGHGRTNQRKIPALNAKYNKIILKTEKHKTRTTKTTSEHVQNDSKEEAKQSVCIGRIGDINIKSFEEKKKTQIHRQKNTEF